MTQCQIIPKEERECLKGTLEALKYFRFSRAYPKEQRRNTKLILAGKEEHKLLRTNRIA